MKLSDARIKAWDTRRTKYGAAGHAGAYRTSMPPADPLGKRALAFVISLHVKGDLSEGQCCKALRLDRVSFRELVDAAEGR